MKKASAILDCVLELIFAVLEYFVDTAEGPLLLQGRVVALFEDLLEAVDGVEELVDDLIEVDCCNGGRLINDIREIAS